MMRASATTTWAMARATILLPLCLALAGGLRGAVVLRRGRRQWGLRHARWRRVRGRLSRRQGETQCNASIIETCDKGAGGCLEWAESEECSALGLSRADAGEGATCSCELCPAVGDTRCNGEVIETCAQGVDGCREWVAGEDCSSSDRICALLAGDRGCVMVRRLVLPRCRRACEADGRGQLVARHLGDAT